MRRPSIAKGGGMNTLLCKKETPKEGHQNMGILKKQNMGKDTKEVNKKIQKMLDQMDSGADQMMADIMMLPKEEAQFLQSAVRIRLKAMNPKGDLAERKKIKQYSRYYDLMVGLELTKTTEERLNKQSQILQPSLRPGLVGC